MNFRLETYIAFKYLRSKRQESFISVSSFFSFIGITLGVATLIIVMSVMNGFREELINKIVGINGSVIVYLNKSNKNNDYNNLINEIEDINNVSFTSKEIEFQAMLNSISSSTGVLVKGISLEDLYERKSISKNIVEGDISNFNNKGIIIGSKLASYLNVNINDDINILTAFTSSSPFGRIPISDNYKIIATFDVGMYEFDRGIIFIPINEALNLQGDNSVGHKLEVFLENNQSLKSIAFDIKSIVKENGKVLTWQNIHKEFFNALKIEKKVMFLILSLIIFIAAFNLISSVIMIVKDKEKGIGILRSLGVNKNEILRIFIIVGSIVGLCGTFIGGLLGIIISQNIGEIQIFLEGLFQTSLFSSKIYFFDIIPSQINYKEVCTIFLISILLSISSTIYPALKASRIDPANILRYE